MSSLTCGREVSSDARSAFSFFVHPPSQHIHSPLSHLPWPGVPWPQTDPLHLCLPLPVHLPPSPTLHVPAPPTSPPPPHHPSPPPSHDSPRRTIQTPRRIIQTPRHTIQPPLPPPIILSPQPAMLVLNMSMPCAADRSCTVNTKRIHIPSALLAGAVTAYQQTGNRLAGKTDNNKGSNKLTGCITEVLCNTWLQAFGVARQMLSLVAGSAIDEYLLSQLRQLRQSHTLARIIHALQNRLWPGGVWFQHTDKYMQQHPVSALN